MRAEPSDETHNEHNTEELNETYGTEQVEDTKR